MGRCVRWASGPKAARLPVTIRGRRLRGIRFINEKASAQVKSAILLAGLRAEGDVEVIEPKRSRDHTENMLRAFGCEVMTQDGIVRLGKSPRFDRDPRVDSGRPVIGGIRDRRRSDRSRLAGDGPERDDEPAAHRTASRRFGKWVPTCESKTNS